jgi:hypothetical protein
MLCLICVVCVAWHHTANHAIKMREKKTHLVKSDSNHQHLLILMGRGAHLKVWMQTVLDSSNLTHVALVLGIFDDSVATLECSNYPKRRVSCVSVAGTTWTTGRNKLIETAFATEPEQNKTYSFWTLADADILLHCQHSLSTGECFSQYDTFLYTLPENAAAATLIANGSWPSTPNSAMIRLHGMDAAWNSFRRNAVHILFPYQPDLDANTWWSSQAIFWYRLQCLAPLYVVTPLYIFFINTEHTDYPRYPRNFSEEHRVGTKMIGKLSGVLHQAPSHFSLEFKQDKIRPLPLAAEQQMDEVFYLCSKEFSSN